jgi:DNA (cytosine-5)-methyltransferase 1
VQAVVIWAVAVKLYWFTKAKRAQNVDDYETWIQGGVVPTLNAMDNNGEVFATVLIIDGTRVNDVRVYEDGIVPTVISRYGTGGGNVPMIFSHTQGLDIQASETNSPTLRTGGAGMAVIYPIDDARELEKHQNGTGIGAEGAPAYTLDRQQLPAVALAFDLYNQQVTEKNQTLSSAASDASHTGTIWEGSVVRRLTPTECERLQGFPDGWTDGQADSNRYKQMGNAVAVPVVEWIISQMVAEQDE